MSDRVLLCTGCDAAVEMRLISSMCDVMQTAAVSIRAAQRDRRASVCEAASATTTRLSDQLGEAVELAASELLSAARHLCTAVVTDLP